MWTATEKVPLMVDLLVAWWAMHLALQKAEYLAGPMEAVKAWCLAVLMADYSAMHLVRQRVEC